MNKNIYIYKNRIYACIHENTIIVHNKVKITDFKNQPIFFYDCCLCPPQISNIYNKSYNNYMTFKYMRN